MCTGIVFIIMITLLLAHVGNKWLKPPVNLLLAVPRRLYCFGSLAVLDVVFRYLSLFLIYINIKIGKNRCVMLD